MEKFKNIRGIAAPFNFINVDTDKIIPKQFLKTIKRTGLGKHLFDEMRFNDDGTEKKGFVLNEEPYRSSNIIVAGDNFGCGSSREHAVWSLMDYGFKVVIAESFADIFYNNCFNNGLLPVQLPEEIISQLFVLSEENKEIEIDLIEQIISCEGNKLTSFDIDPFRKQCILEGLDEIGLSLKHAEAIKEYELNRSKVAPWIFNVYE